jgi:hypothetical protein
VSPSLTQVIPRSPSAVACPSCYLVQSGEYPRESQPDPGDPPLPCGCCLLQLSANRQEAAVSGQLLHLGEPAAQLLECALLLQQTLLHAAQAQLLPQQQAFKQKPLQGSPVSKGLLLSEERERMISRWKETE